MNKTKKTLMSIAALAMCGTMAFAVAGCGGGHNYTGEEKQGVKVQQDGKVIITVGNTAPTSGAYASYGVPFNYGLEAWLWQYEQTHSNIKFDFKHYDDEFNGSKGFQYTQQLVEQDKVFALVGHYGTNTLEATVDYITDTGVPMVYAATGVNSLYNDNAKGYERAIMSVQPIYKTEGRSLVATAVAPAPTGLAGTKVGCIYTTDDAGKSIYEGIKEEAGVLGVKIEAQAVDFTATDYSSAVNALKSKECDVVIVAAIQTPFSKVATQFIASNYDNVKIITSYVSASGTTMSELVANGVATETRKLYAGGWVNLTDLTKYDVENNPYALSDEAMAFATTVIGYGVGVKGLDVTAASAYSASSYTIAGYIAGYTFTQGIDRLIKDKTDLTEEDFTWLKYVEAMESEPVDVALTQGVTIDLSNGQRYGVTALSLIEFNASNIALGGTTIRPLTALEDIENAYKNK